VRPQLSRPLGKLEVRRESAATAIGDTLR
jgi:hypothetical protein